MADQVEKGRYYKSIATEWVYRAEESISSGRWVNCTTICKGRKGTNQAFEVGETIDINIKSLVLAKDYEYSRNLKLIIGE